MTTDKLREALEIALWRNDDPEQGYVLHPENAEQMREALTHLTALEKEREWQSIESAPRDGTEIFVKDEWGIIKHVFWCKEMGGCWAIKDHDEGQLLNPMFQKHWKHLDKPPTIASCNQEKDDISKCPGCGGDPDNGHDRCDPPSPYYCTKCEAKKAWRE